MNEMGSVLWLVIMAIWTALRINLIKFSDFQFIYFLFLFNFKVKLYTFIVLYVSCCDGEFLVLRGPQSVKLKHIQRYETLFSEAFENLVIIVLYTRISSDCVFTVILIELVSLSKSAAFNRSLCLVIDFSKDWQRSSLRQLLYVTDYPTISKKARQTMDIFSQEQVEKFRVIFEQFDKNGDGDISAKELKGALKQLGQDTDTKSCKKMIKTVNKLICCNLLALLLYLLFWRRHSDVAVIA